MNMTCDSTHWLRKLPHWGLATGAPGGPGYGALREGFWRRYPSQAERYRKGVRLSFSEEDGGQVVHGEGTAVQRPGKGCPRTPGKGKVVSSFPYSREGGGRMGQGCAWARAQGYSQPEAGEARRKNTCQKVSQKAGRAQPSSQDPCICVGGSASVPPQP